VVARHETFDAILIKNQKLLPHHLTTRFHQDVGAGADRVEVGMVCVCVCVCMCVWGA